MKKLTLILSFVVCALAADAQDYLWANGAGGNSSDYGASCTTDASGNVIITGNFESSSFSIGNTTLFVASRYDMFIAKYDSSGNALWAKCAGGNSWDFCNSAATDANGNSIVTGYFLSPSISFDSTTITNAGSSDIFIVKYDPSGNVLWAKSAGGTKVEFGYGVATDANGNIIVTGLFGGSSISFDSTTLSNAGLGDIFIVKYDPSGNVLWAKRAGGTGDDFGSIIATDADGNIIASGYFESPSISFDSSTMTNAGNGDIFIAKYDSGGNVLWAKSAGGADYDNVSSIATDADGNIFASGYFESPSISFGSITLTNPSPSLSSVFLVKYDAAGNVLWAKKVGGPGYEYFNSIATDANGNLIATGYFESPTIGLDSITITNAGAGDLLFVKYDADGNVLWASSAGGPGIESGYGIATDANGSIITTGFFRSSTISFGATTLTNSGSDDIFLMKLDDAVTGITENIHLTRLDIFPNPFSAQTTFRTERFLEDANLIVYNIHGQLVKQINHISGQTVTLSGGDLASGLYFIQLSEDNRIIATGKLSVTD